MTREFNLAKWYRNLCAEGGGMTREEIKQIGIAAGISPHAFGLASEEAWQQVERFAALVAKAEREACAMWGDSVARDIDETNSTNIEIKYAASYIAKGIRARGQE